MMGLQARAVLQRQIKEREDQKQEAFEQFLRDKKICDNIQQAMVRTRTRADRIMSYAWFTLVHSGWDVCTPTV